MQGFTIVDGVVAVVIILSAILAYSRGLVREVLAIAGWVVAAVVAYSFAHQAEPLMQEVPVLGEFLKGSCELSIIAAFTAVFAVALIVMSFFTPLFSSVVRNSVLGGLDQGLGFLFGVARGVILVAVAFLVYQRTMSAEAMPMVTQSRSSQVFAQVENQISNQIPADAPGWVQEQYLKLVGNCGERPTGGLQTAPAVPGTGGAASGSGTGAATGTGTTGGTTSNGAAGN